MAIVHLVSSSGLAQDIRARTHRLTADEPKSLGGTDTGPSPYELVMSGLAACTSLTLRMYAARKDWDLGRIEVEIRFLRDEAGNEAIDRTIGFSGMLTEEQRNRLAEIAERTPVTKTIRRGTPIRTTLRPPVLADPSD